MSRVGIYAGKKVLFTHRNPQTGEYWTDEYWTDELRQNARSPLGMWVDSKNINFDTKQPEKAQHFKKSGRRSRG